MKPIITFSKVTFSYENDPVLENITFDIHENDFIGLIGPNGGGKTTILKLMLGVIKPNKGQINILGKPPNNVRHIIGYLPQYSKLDDTFPITVEQVVAMGLFTNFSFLPFISKKQKFIIYENLEKVNIKNLAKKQYGNLSGGQKQRCLLARAIISSPRILLLDEPTSSVDSNVEKDIYEFLKNMNENITIILVSHDLGFVSSYINRVFCVNKKIACHKTDDISMNEIINEIYEGNINAIHHECKL